MVIWDGIQTTTLLVTDVIEEKLETKNLKGNESTSKNDADEDNNNNSTKFPKKAIPMFKLSNIQHSKRFNKKGIKRWSQYKQFNKLFEHCCQSQKNPLFSTDYALMQKMKAAVERIQNVKQKNCKKTSINHCLTVCFVEDNCSLFFCLGT